MSCRMHSTLGARVKGAERKEKRVPQASAERADRQLDCAQHVCSQVLGEMLSVRHESFIGLYLLPSSLSEEGDAVGGRPRHRSRSPRSLSGYF